jgi:hypothetical protein
LAAIAAGESDNSKAERKQYFRRFHYFLAWIAPPAGAWNKKYPAWVNRCMGIFQSRLLTEIHNNLSRRSGERG